MDTLNGQQIEEALESLPGWQLKDNGIEREFKFNDFDSAWVFMAQLAEHARRLDHHPDWSNSYNRVRVRLTTHDAGGVTARDLELARLAQQAAPGG
jgi:4a-hydroxytetrahydrobiopterin dehydratase